MTPNELILTFGVYTSVSNLVKIDEEKCDRESVHRRTDTHTHRRKTILLSVPCYML